MDSLNCSFDKGESSSSQKQAIITLISNWRPISLINVDVKIGSKAIALRLQTILPKIIPHNQHAYVKGRTINDAIRTMDYILVYAERYGINGKMLQAVAKRLRHSVEISPLPPKTLFPNLKRSRNAPSPPPPIAMLIPFSFNARSR